MTTYAKYKYTTGWEAKRIGEGWHKVEREYMMRYPSGLRNTVVINGVAVKADHCELVQVF